jgi:CRP-like cAMP-binding protein
MSAESVVEFEPGDVIFKEKDNSDCLYIIKEGQVAIYKGTGDDALPIALIGSGEFLGEMSLIVDNLRSTTAKALSPVKAVKMSKSTFKANLSKTPPWVQGLIKGLASRLYRMDELAKKHNVVDEKAAQAIEAVTKKFAKPDSAA